MKKRQLPPIPEHILAIKNGDKVKVRLTRAIDYRATSPTLIYEGEVTMYVQSHNGRPTIWVPQGFNGEECWASYSIDDYSEHSNSFMAEEYEMVLL